MPIVAVAVLDEEVVRGLPTFAERLDTFLRKRPDLATCVDLVNARGQRLMAVVNKERLDPDGRPAGRPGRVLVRTRRPLVVQGPPGQTRCRWRWRA